MSKGIKYFKASANMSLQNNAKTFCIPAYVRLEQKKTWLQTLSSPTHMKIGSDHEF